MSDRPQARGPGNSPGNSRGSGGGGDETAAAATAEAVARAGGDGVRAVVLVEGASDQAAVEALAQRRGRDLAAEGVVVVPMGGATSIGAFLERFGPAGADLRLAGLCDAREEGAFRRQLERAGLGPWPPGFHVCDADLEDELIRALGPEAVEQIVAAEGELRSFRTFQRQPAQQDRTLDAQLRRFVGTRGGRKVRYGRLLVEALDLDRVPGPLDRLLADV
jgi:hypothetical protein